ncbi:DUF5709 domain-containing protein [Actinacidiphila yeochonensis]|uniref:DUF5709 domain-containing protein n=1 Tax=Actinacidiphila yeochonensis TaxID=89050 RepID=UPI00056D8D59|nr:DUF5709 domain-containing protein [Actinacidiphila yeochonensis]
MTEGSMGDDVYQPTGDDDGQEDDPLDMEDALGEDDYDEVLDKGYSPPEKPYAIDGSGTTAREQREGESLDERLAEEVPDDVGAEDGGHVGGEGEPGRQEAGDERAGRLVAPGQGVERPVEDDTVAEDAGIDGGAASAEEAAVHRIDDPGADED